ncbi:MAG: ComEC/Rec2 family competence protein [Patescibacteria group bacterium]
MTLQRKGHYKLLVFVLILVVIAGYLLYLDSKSQKHELTFAMLDIGQGDALFIESPTGTQILVDGGPPRKILGELAKVMSPFDKTIDAIIVTNPDADHISGFGDVLKAYKVGAVFEPGTVNDSKTYQNLETEIKNKNIPDILVKKGMRLNLGGGAVIDILFPDRDVFDWSTNDGSIVAKLTYGEDSVMLTGDATAKTEGIVLQDFSAKDLHSTVLKVGHHGSRTSSSEAFVKAVAPQYAVISDGKDNKYGHPHQETLDTLNNVHAQIFRTDLLGTIIMQSDGHNVSFSFKK